MDCGLGVRWPLSPYATALAAGAIVGFCVALWKHCSETKSEKDLGGQISGSDLEPKDKTDVDDKKKKEKVPEKTHFPISSFRDVNLCASGNFGAIPRTTTQRSRTLEAPNLFSALRRRNIDKESKSWHEINPATSNFSCIYQQSFCLGNEVPRLNARFVLNVSPYLNQYLRQFYQFRDLQVPELPGKSEFENFDVSINPEILKDKPITRSAVCLTLEKQLHKILNGNPPHEVAFNDRAFQTSIFSKKSENKFATNEGKGQNLSLGFGDGCNNDVFSESGNNLHFKKFNLNSSLWDSGYCEKSFDERCTSPKSRDENPEFLSTCCKGFSDSDNDSEVSNIAKQNDSSIRSCDNFINSGNVLNNFNPDLFLKPVDECIETLSDAGNISEGFNTYENRIIDESIKNTDHESKMNFSLINKLEMMELNPNKEVEIHPNAENISEITDTKNSVAKIQLKSSTENIFEITDIKSVLENQVECNIKDISPEVDSKNSAPKNQFETTDIKQSVLKNQVKLDIKDISPEDNSKNSAPKNQFEITDIKQSVLENQVKLNIKDISPEVDSKNSAQKNQFEIFDIKQSVLENQVKLNIKDISPEVDSKNSVLKNQFETTDIKQSVLENQVKLNIKDISSEVDSENSAPKNQFESSFENVSDSIRNKNPALTTQLNSSVKNISQIINGKNLSENQLKSNVRDSFEITDNKNITPECNLKSITENISQVINNQNPGLDNISQIINNENSPEPEKFSPVIDNEIENMENFSTSNCANISSVTDISSKIKLKSKDSVIYSSEDSMKAFVNESIKKLPFKSQNSDLEQFQRRISSPEREEQKSADENIFHESENILMLTKNLDYATRAAGVDLKSAESGDKSIKHSAMGLADSNLEEIQNARFDSGKEQNDMAPSPAIEAESGVFESDVTLNDSSRDPAVFEERGTPRVPRQMDRETGERSVAVESSVTTETTLHDATRFSTAVVSRLTLEDWADDNSVSVKTTVSEEIFRPTFEEFVPLKSSEKIPEVVSRNNEELLLFDSGGNNGHELSPNDSSLPSSPRVERLKGLMSRDEERRARAKFHHLAAADSGHVEGDREGEWDRLLRDVLASVSELERWERDVSADAEDAEEQQRHHPDPSQSDSSFSEMEEGGALLSPGKGSTPTKIKSLRFKLDPDVFDVPSDDSFYDDDDEEVHRGWKKQTKYRAYSLEVKDEPVRLVSVHASVVPAGQKMVARPVGIDLRVRLTEERQSKRAHVSTSPSQAKRRSPVSDRGVGWCQELSPVTENVDWRDTFTPVNSECKTVPNGILKTPSPKIEPLPVESPNPFKLENGVTTNGVSPVVENKHVDKPKYNGVTPWRPVERKPFLLPRKKFEPDPEAIERITGYKTALSKPPLPPPVFDRINATKIAIKKAELARKQYLDSKAALSAGKADGMKKFQQFLNQAQDDRARIMTSVPDLAAIERAVTEQWMKEMKERESVSPRESPVRENGIKIDDATVSRGNTPDDKWASYVQSCRQHLGKRSQSMTYLETDIDIIPILDEDDKCLSTSALDEPDEALPDPDVSDTDRSREDLDDSGRAKSEHELRIERSLRSMPVPDWYRRSEKTKTGFLLGSSAKEKRGWAAAKSLASSTSSLASCGLRRPVRSLRSSRENIPWSRSSASPDGPTLSLALAKAFREPYLGWRARTPTSSGVSSSPRASPPSWGATTTDDEVNGVSFDGEDAFGRTTSSEDDRRDEPLSLDDTGADAVTVSMDTNDPVKLPGGEDTCDDINNMSMDTCELFDPASVVVPVDEDPSPQADTGDDIDNLSTDTTTTEGRKLDPKLKRYSYSQSIYHSEWEEEEESRGDRKVVKGEDRDPSSNSPDHKVVWIESSFVGSRTTTSIMVLPEKKAPTPDRPASR